MDGMNSIILFKTLKDNELLGRVEVLIEEGDASGGPYGEFFYDSFCKIIRIAETHGFEGNLWHAYLTYQIVMDENPYALACEMRGAVDGTISRLALHDFAVLKEVFAFPFESVVSGKEAQLLSLVTDYKRANDDAKMLSRPVQERICALAGQLANAETPEQFMELVTAFYRDYGVGNLGLHRAFRIKQALHRPTICPIHCAARVHLDDLVGYEIPKAKLIENTEAFVKGRKANNCLLFGDAGTGKSTSIKAILNEYYDQGLRMIEIYKHQFRDLGSLISLIKDRNYKFIIYMDDLSFEEFETEYKYLKAVIEGGLEKRPDNVLIYATSNRRHLVRENFGDKEGRRDDLHASDTVQEKLSLFHRFGVSIFFEGPDKKEFDHIVLELARRAGISMPEEELLLLANKWELEHGGRSGRAAQQFVDYLLGKQ